jgi:hypothetical protein
VRLRAVELADPVGDVGVVDGGAAASCLNQLVADADLTSSKVLVIDLEHLSSLRPMAQSQ